MTITLNEEEEIKRITEDVLEGDCLEFSIEEDRIVEMNVYSFPGQCGARILADFDFRNPISNYDAVGKQLTEELLKIGGGFKLFMSDKKGGRMYRLLENQPEWEQGEISINPNTGNKIRVFELTT